MKSLHEIFRRKDKPEISRIFSANEMIPFFQSLGIDITKMDFFGLKMRDNIPTMAYWCNFEDVQVTPVRVDGKLQNRVLGKYHVQPKASYKDACGGWHPGARSTYKFKIDNGVLDIKYK